MIGVMAVKRFMVGILPGVPFGLVFGGDGCHSTHTIKYRR